MSSYVPDNNSYCDEYENCPEFLERYLDYARNNQGKRPLTLSETALILREYCQFIHYRNVIQEIPPTADAHKDMGISRMELSELAITQIAFEEYVSFLDNVSRNAAATLNKKLSIIRTFYTYLIRMQADTGVSFPCGNPVAEVKAPSVAESRSLVLSINQMQQLLDAVPEETRFRDRAILLLLSTTGITLSELSVLKKEDITDKCWLRVQGKNGIRYLYLTPATQTALQTCLFHENADSPVKAASRYIFASEKNWDQSLTPRTIRNIVIKVGVLANLQTLEITPKVLRDTVADCLYSTAGEYERHRVSCYLGYRIPLPRRSIRNTAVTSAVDPLMKQLVKRSPLVHLGISDAQKEV